MDQLSPACPPSGMEPKIQACALARNLISNLSVHRTNGAIPTRAFIPIWNVLSIWFLYSTFPVNIFYVPFPHTIKRSLNITSKNCIIFHLCLFHDFFSPIAARKGTRSWAGLPGGGLWCVGSWTWCREDVATWVQVIVRGCGLKLRTLRQGRAWDRGSHRREPERGLAREELPLPVALQVVSLMGTLRV